MSDFIGKCQECCSEFNFHGIHVIGLKNGETIKCPIPNCNNGIVRIKKTENQNKVLSFEPKGKNIKCSNCKKICTLLEKNRLLNEKKEDLIKKTCSICKLNQIDKEVHRHIEFVEV